MIRGLRGATTVNKNEEAEILSNTLILVKEMAERNHLKPESISHVFISVTQDLNATFPAKVLREIPGWSHVPVMCMTEIDVPSGLKKCIRIMMAIATDQNQKDLEHIYLNDAVKLRPDLVETKTSDKSLEAKQTLSTLNSYQQGMQIEDVKESYNLESIVKLSSNENPYGSSPDVTKFLQEQKLDLALYPDGYTAKLRDALSSELQVDKDDIVFGSGSDELVQIISRTYLTPQSHVIMAKPTFPQYRHHAVIEGASFTEVPNHLDGSHDLDTMLQSINESTKIIWLCNPNNPTGTIIDQAKLERFIKKVPKHILIVFDEAYYEYVSEDLRVDSIRLLKESDNIIVLRTFSKAYGLAGIRIGYGIANPSIIYNLNIVRGPFNTSSISQEAAIIALEDKDFLNEVVGENRRIRNTFSEFLNSIGWKCYKSETNFVLVKTPVDDNEVFEYLLRRGFIVRPGSKLGQPNTVRITIGKEDDMLRLQEVIQEFNDK